MGDPGLMKKGNRQNWIPENVGHQYMAPRSEGVGHWTTIPARKKPIITKFERRKITARINKMTTNNKRIKDLLKRTIAVQTRALPITINELKKCKIVIAANPRNEME
jgi:hypothetical protein